MAEIRSAPLVVLSLQTGGMQGTGATSGSNRPLEWPVSAVFEVV
jgi:hypothetical protein